LRSSPATFRGLYRDRFISFRRDGDRAASRDGGDHDRSWLLVMAMVGSVKVIRGRGSRSLVVVAR